MDGLRAAEGAGANLESVRTALVEALRESARCSNTHQDQESHQHASHAPRSMEQGTSVAIHEWPVA